MAVLKCKMCGGDLVLNSDSTIAECEFCGTQQTVPTADNEKKITLFQRANRLRFACEFDKAAGIYESIVAEFPEEAEAYWGLILCKYGIEYVDDPATAKKIPTCHRSSFDSVMDDSNFELVMENADSTARGVYRNEAKQIEELRKSIIEVSSKEEPYDIFICYKETAPDGDRTIDSVIAQDVYDALTEKGYRVFFSRITLEDKLGQEYEPYIFAALNSAKIMLAFGTDYEYYNAVWVKNEWSRFLQLIAKGEKKTLIPCYKNIDAYDMPKEFAKLQAQDMGKVGAIQDLLRGIAKIITGNTEMKSVSAVNKSTGALTKRGYFFLEDGDFKTANEYFDKSLDENPEDSKAYVGKVLAMLQMSDISEIENNAVHLSADKNFERAIRFATESEKDLLVKIKENADKKWFAKCFANYVQKIANIKAAFLKVAEVENGILKKYKGNEKDVYIPSSVKSIGKMAFVLCKSLTSVTILDGVTNICEKAFSLCESLTSVTIPESVTTIDDGAFSGCDSLTNIIIYGENFRFVDNCLIDVKRKRIVCGFRNAKIPQDFSVTSIGKMAFSCCKSFKSVTIPDNITSIGKSAFWGCKSLTSVTIPESVTSIGDGVFSNCDSLTNIIIYGDNFCFIDNCLIEVNQKKIICGFKDAKIPQDGSVTSIGESAFRLCKSLTSVTIPDYVTSIGENAFLGCESLASVTIPNSVTSISTSVFSDCKSFTSVAIPNSVTNIGEYAFHNCASLTSVTIPGSVTSIGKSAFGGCKSLESVTIPDSVTSIGSNAFWNDTIIYANEGSYALTWAKKNGYQYVNLTEEAEHRAKEAERIAKEEKERCVKEAERRAKEAERRAKEEEERRLQKFRAQGVCQHCGGKFKGIFSQKCASCGKPKDY